MPCTIYCSCDSFYSDEIMYLCDREIYYMWRFDMMVANPAIWFDVILAK